jgi:hypothetical protein
LGVANVYSMTVDERRDDPLLRLLDAAPVDDEPETNEERTAMAEVEADRAAGVATISFDDVKRAHRGAWADRSLEAPVGVAPVRDANEDDTTALVVDLVHDPPVADADAVITASRQFRASARPRLEGGTVDGVVHATPDLRREPAVVALARGSNRIS